MFETIASKNATFSPTSFLRFLPMIAVISLTLEWGHANDAKRIVTKEKAKLISAAMESSLEGLPKLYESVSTSIVRVETKDNINVTGVIVSWGGHIQMFPSVEHPGLTWILSGTSVI